MASVSIVVTDSKNGVISNSFHFTDQEINKVIDALKIIYKGHTREPIDDEVIEERDTNKELFTLLSKNLMTHVLQTVYNTEVQEKVKDVKQSIKMLEIRNI